MVAPACTVVGVSPAEFVDHRRSRRMARAPVFKMLACACGPRSLRPRSNMRALPAILLLASPAFAQHPPPTIPQSACGRGDVQYDVKKDQGQHIPDADHTKALAISFRTNRPSVYALSARSRRGSAWTVPGSAQTMAALIFSLQWIPASTTCAPTGNLATARFLG